MIKFKDAQKEPVKFSQESCAALVQAVHLAYAGCFPVLSPQLCLVCCQRELIPTSHGVYLRPGEKLMCLDRAVFQYPRLAWQIDFICT